MFTTPAQSPGQQYALAAVLSILPTIFTFLRFYARRLKKNALLWDDWLIVVALVSLASPESLLRLACLLADGSSSPI
jgi:hypothetical protein